MIPENEQVKKWVEEMQLLCKPDKLEWLDGSETEKQRLIKEAVKKGELVELNQKKIPGCYLHRSAPNDVSRTENLTFICTSRKEDTTPLANWMAPKEAYKKLGEIFEGAMKGRTMYVVPFIMGIPKSKFSKVCVQLTDSVYVALNIRILARMGKIAWKELGKSNNFTRGLHSVADLNENRKFICHFPEDNAIWSVGSGYGGNALLGKKCLALRIASHQARKEGWMAEHMMLIGVESPEGKITYIAGAFPSQCGKTNLAMLKPPESMKGWRVWTVGDDIAWMRVGSDGRLYAVNAEAGFFGVAPGTSYKTNPNAMETLKKNSIFTNVLLKEDGTVWWEGMDGVPSKGTDWQGNPWTPDSGKPGAQPNSRFTAPASQCPSISPEWENPKGVPISAILFGGRRAKLAPLVYEAFNWQHGTFIGATMASETTAAATGQVGIVRRDPMAMLPFFGYRTTNYFRHWIEMGKKIRTQPKIFHVNWFKTDGGQTFLWPGFRENMRVLKWIVERCSGKADAEKTPIGFMPKKSSIDLNGLEMPDSAMKKLLSVDKNAWMQETIEQEEFFKELGSGMPKEILEEHAALKRRLKG